MKEFGGNTITKEFIKTIWMERLSVNSEVILSTSPGNLSETVKMVHEIKQIREIPGDNEVAMGESTRKQIEELRKEIAKIKTQISGFFFFKSK